jgi:hypothetical protein
MSYIITKFGDSSFNFPDQGFWSKESLSKVLKLLQTAQDSRVQVY